MSGQHLYPGAGLLGGQPQQPIGAALIQQQPHAQAQIQQPVPIEVTNPPLASLHTRSDT